ncbi:MAG: response regulator [Moorea sp. SIO2B7]|nr:response regulator [Moorena sp. SIO2B7]
MVDNQRNIELVQLNGDLVYIAYVPLRHANWSIALVIPRQNIESDLKPLNIMVIVIAALACAMIAVLWRVQSFEQTQLKKSKEAADTANKAKSEFLANMSHELRTPLNAILGFTQLMLRDSSLRRQDRENLGIISRSGEHLLSLINDVLDMSKIEAGRITLNPHNFDLYRLLDTIKEIFDLKADSKGLELIFERTADVPQYVQTDEKKLRQVLINLLSNAFKFTEEGGVYVSLTKKQSSRHVHLDTRDNNELISDDYCLLITVRDTGLGIAPHEIDRLFEAFVQTETGRKSQKGTGLGLPISRQFVQLMGGELTVSSKLGEGTIFQFEIEVKQVEETEIESQQPTRKIIALAPDQPTYRILIVDDRWTNRQLLLKMLVPLGFEVREAENGQEAIEVWDNWEPHLIWMDMRMPVMDGYEATKQIKSHLKGQATVIIALTASTFEEERAVVLSAGCDDFVRKPFQDAKIFAKMSEFLGVCYVYEDLAHSGLSESETTIEELTPQRLAVMSTEWIVELNQAATKLNERLILTLIEQIPPKDASVAKSLIDLVNQVRFDVIVSLSEEAMALS